MQSVPSTYSKNREDGKNACVTYLLQSEYLVAVVEQ